MNYKVIDISDVEEEDDSYDIDDNQDLGKYAEKILGEEERNESYHLFYPSPLKEGEDPFAEVIGQDNQKKELCCVIDWFNHSNEWMEKGICIPRGVILYGRPGTGKTLMMRALIRVSQCPVLVYEGQSQNPARAMMEIFQKAKELSHAVVLIDELDLVVYRKPDVQRVLQQNMDGIESMGDILVIAAANNLNHVPEALLRSGRFSKEMSIDKPTFEERKKLFRYFCNQYHLTLSDDIDESGISYSLDMKTGADIKELVNDVILRNGFTNITQEMIENSINCLEDIYGHSEKPRKNVAYHEAAHCIMAMKYPKYLVIDSLNLYDGGGYFKAPVIDENDCNYEILLANIRTLLAGNIAEKLFFKTASVGCDNDLNNARNQAYGLVNRVGYCSCWRTLPISDERNRRESQVKLRNNEKKIESILRKCERQTRWYLRRHKKEIQVLGDLLYKKSYLSKRQIMECLNGMKK